MFYKNRVSTCSNSLKVFRSTLYFHEVQKLASVPYSSLSHWKPWSYFHCCQINKICFHKYDNHKTIEILCCKSENLKDKVIQLFKVTRISLFLYIALICVMAPMNRFRHRLFDIFSDISFLPIHLCA